MMRIIEQVADKYKVRSPWTPVYGTARSLLALGTLLTLLFNSDQSLFISLEKYFSKEALATTSLFMRCNLFVLFVGHLWIAKSIAALILLVTISGWRPPVTGWLHFWVAISFSTLSSTLDGGDTITSIITFFLIPVCSTDKRRSHWDARPALKTDPYITLFIWSVCFVIRLQVCIIYLHSGIDKLRIDEWVNGTCTYYWFTNTTYGVMEGLRPFMMRLLSQPVIVVVVTWGTILFEIFLGMSIFMKRNSFNWKILLVVGLLFHLGIVFIFGLVTFFMAMAACLFLYLVPWDYTTKNNRFFTAFPAQAMPAK